MSQRPTFADNRDTTLADAIERYAQELLADLAEPPTVDIASGYFDPRGYAAVADTLESLGETRIMLGAEPEQKDRVEWNAPGAARGADYDADRIETALHRLDADLKEDRDLLGFSRGVDDDLQRLIDFLDREDVSVRRYEDGFLHGKAYLFGGDRGVLAGSSNFTGAGLQHNLELNLGHYQPQVTSEVAEWFDELWHDAEPYDLASLYEERFEPYDPYLIYLRMLYERYGDRLGEDGVGEDGDIELAGFQQHGADRALRFLEEHNGVIVGDEVGLGKTYIAGKLLEEYVENRRQHALVVAPAYLRDGMWRNVREEWGFRFDVLSYAELREEPKLDPERDTWDPSESNLDFDPDDYQLVVVDEGHAFRNPNTKQAKALRRLLRGTPPKDLVLVTATPVNNSLWDLYYLVNYFVRNDAAFADEGIRSLRERFKTAQAQNPAELSPDLLFDVLDRTTVRRTRRFIKERYEDAKLPDGTGGKTKITFPEPEPKRVDYTFEDTFDDEFFDSIRRGLGGADETGEPELTLARYKPLSILEEEEDQSELSLVGLLRTGLLKRFESSSHAFANTLDRMIEQYKAALVLLQNGYVPETDAIEEWTEGDDDEAFEDAFDSAETEDTGNLTELQSDHDEGALWEALQADLALLERWYDRAKTISRRDDEKLDTLREALVDVADRAEADARADPTPDAAQQNRKILIFSYFQDTVEWITEYLREAVTEDEQLAPYEGRIAAVSGDGVAGEVSQTEAIQGFAPDSTDAPDGTEDQFDILVTTDVLGQGVNLQQARNVVNYDLPWNPMRVVQRNGRIDRIDSPHDTVFPHTFFPEDRLEDLLELENRVRRKLTQAAQSVGLDNEIIPGMQTREQNFTDRVEQIEAMREEDPEQYQQRNAEAAAFSGEEFRQLLRDGLEDRPDEILTLPWGAGSGFVGENPGYVFCARVGDEEYLRFVPPDDDEVVSDSLTCLQRAECTDDTERHLSEEMRDGVYEAWQAAQADIHAEWQAQTDPKNVEPDIPKVFREVGDHLQNYPPTGMDQEALADVVKSIQAPTGERHARTFREIHRDEDLTPREKSDRFVKAVREIGLQPFEAPEPRTPIGEEEIKLVCWVAIESRRSEEGTESPLASQVMLD